MTGIGALALAGLLLTTMLSPSLSIPYFEDNLDEEGAEIMRSEGNLGPLSCMCVGSITLTLSNTLYRWNVAATFSKARRSGRISSKRKFCCC